MSNKFTDSKFSLKPVAVLLGSAVALSSVSLANAAENPFQLNSLNAGYTVAENPSGGAEGKCGEGKCGEGKKKMKKMHSECMKRAKKRMEGKCGEGKCGESKKTEGKCGEGKCGEGKI